MCFYVKSGANIGNLKGRTANRNETTQVPEPVFFKV